MRRFFLVACQLVTRHSIATAMRPSHAYMVNHCLFSLLMTQQLKKWEWPLVVFLICQMVSGKSHSCATSLAKVGLLMSGSQKWSWTARRHASSVWPHTKCCYLHTDGSVMWTYNKEDCKPGDCILLQRPVQVVDGGCSIHLTPFCGHFPVRSTELCRLCQSSCLIQLALRYQREIGMYFSHQNRSSFSFPASATACLNKHPFFPCKLCPFFCWR